MSQKIDGYVGTARISDSASDVNAAGFLVKQLLAKTRIATLVQVKAVTNAGGVEPVGTVDIQPLVSSLDGAGNIVAHGLVTNVPYSRLQGGANAVILDPQVGDIGIALFADRDISVVKTTKKGGAPGSGRRNSMADALYVGGVLNGTPSQYVRFSGDGIDVVSPTKVTVSAPDIELNGENSVALNAPTIILNGALDQGNGSYAGDANLGGTLTVDKDVIADGVSLVNHLTSGVEPGDGNSGKPI